MLCSLSKTVKFLSSGMTLYWVNKYEWIILLYSSHLPPQAIFLRIQARLGSETFKILKFWRLRRLKILMADFTSRNLRIALGT